jgi:hypothetical protein
VRGRAGIGTVVAVLDGVTMQRLGAAPIRLIIISRY